MKRGPQLVPRSSALLGSPSTKFKDEWEIPDDEIATLRSRAKWLTIDDIQYGGQRRPLYPNGWVESDPDDQIARLRQLGKLLEHRRY